MSLLAVALFSAAFAIPASARQGAVASLQELRWQGVVMQQWDTTCAAAALATVLTYRFGDPVSEAFVVTRMLEQVGAEQVLARGGFSLLDMRRFVESLGYSGSAFQYIALEDLALFEAAIVPIRVTGFNHYVVFNGLDDRHVRLADPTFGNRRMRVDRFMQVWVDGLVFSVDRPEGDE